MDRPSPMSSSLSLSDSLQTCVRQLPNNPVTIAGLPSSRPELRTTSFYQADHDYLAATGRPFIESLTKCLPAVRLVARHEEALSSENLIGTKDKSFLTKLEKHMLNFAKSEASQGMLYLTLFKHEEIFFARVIESGCLLGSTSDGEFKRVLRQAVPGLSGFLSYNVFSDEDLCTRGVKRKAGSAATRDRPDQQFKRAVDAVKKDLGVMKMNVESRAQCCLVGAVIQLLRKNKPNDRFFWGFSKHTRDWQPVEAALQEFRARGAAAPVRVQMSDVTEGTGLQEQLDSLGTISHNFSNIPSVQGKSSMADNMFMCYPYCFVICSKLSPGKWPRSFRLRLCHFLLNSDLDEVARLVNSQVSARSFLSQQPQFSQFQYQQDPSCSTEVMMELEDTCPPFQQPSSSRRPTLGRRGDSQRRMTAQRLQEVYGLHAEPVHNMSSLQLSIFELFRTSLQEHGQLHWVVNHADRDVFVLNNYSSESGLFQASDFVVSEVIAGSEMKCSCDVFEIAQVSDNTQSFCLHCRFLEQDVLPLMEAVKRPDFIASTLIERKLHAAWMNRSVGCVRIFASGSVLKFCVRGSDDSVAFVHLSKDMRFVRCLSGECSIKEGCKRKLQGLRSAANLCPHLNIFGAYEEVWRQEVPVSADGQEEGDLQEQADDINIEDRGQTPADDELVNYFNPATGLWTFGGLSQHRPMEQKDPKLIRNTRLRVLLIANPRDPDGFLTGHVLCPPAPDTCDCGFGYEAVDVVDGTNLVLVHQTTLYMQMGAVKCDVAARVCRHGQCRVEYNPEEDGIFFWTKETCIADEVGYSFINRMLKMKCSFSSFCADMTDVYRQCDVTAASFVSIPTFIKWFFSWGAAFKFDFRKDVDPWCKHSPKILAGDGTHVGVALRHISITPIEQAEDVREVPTRHRRYDRVLLCQRDGVSPQQLRQAREHLKNICRVVLGEASALLNDPVADAQLRDVCPQEAAAVVEGVRARDFQQDLLAAVANVLYVLACDSPISALLPYADIPEIQNTVHSLQNLQQGVSVPALLHPLRKVSPELWRLLEAAVRTPVQGHKTSVFLFVLYLTERVLAVHSNDQPVAQPQPVVGSYNPPSGVAYYFTDTGEQVRKLPVYTINKEKGGQFDDQPSEEERCRKIYPQVTRGGFSYMFLWFCPLHGHCYGFHLVSGSEGRKDPFCSLYKYLPIAPEVIFYDNACQFSEYSLNREPGFFRETRFFHDCFHGYSHKCSKTFRARRVPSLKVNTEICEQFNARLQCIKYTGSHLSQPRFIFLVQLVLHFWNVSKTEIFSKKVNVALQSMQ